MNALERPPRPGSWTAPLVALLPCLAGLAACGSSLPPPAATALASAAVDWREWLGDGGCFVVRQHSTGTTRTSDPERCALPRRPYSTFKIANALIALDAGLLDGPDAPLPRDLERFPPAEDAIPAWSQDHTLRSGLAVSSVPHFRTLALAVGEARMQAGLESLRYGNRDWSGGLDRFWLTGGLRISAMEQLDLIDALVADRLPLSPSAQAVVREALPRASGDASTDGSGAWTVHFKTGTGDLEDGTGVLAWLVGWVERAGDLYPFAFWLERPTFDEARAARSRAARGILEALGLAAPEL